MPPSNRIVARGGQNPAKQVQTRDAIIVAGAILICILITLRKMHCVIKGIRRKKEENNDNTAIANVAARTQTNTSQRTRRSRNRNNDSAETLPLYRPYPEPYPSFPPPAYIPRPKANEEMPAA